MQSYFISVVVLTFCTSAFGLENPPSLDLAECVKKEVSQIEKFNLSDDAISKKCSASASLTIDKKLAIEMEGLQSRSACKNKYEFQKQLYDKAKEYAGTICLEKNEIVEQAKNCTPKGKVSAGIYYFTGYSTQKGCHLTIAQFLDRLGEQVFRKKNIQESYFKKFREIEEIESEANASQAVRAATTIVSAQHPGSSVNLGGEKPVTIAQPNQQPASPNSALPQSSEGVTAPASTITSSPGSRGNNLNGGAQNSGQAQSIGTTGFESLPSGLNRLKQAQNEYENAENTAKEFKKELRKSIDESAFKQFQFQKNALDNYNIASSYGELDPAHSARIPSLINELTTLAQNYPQLFPKDTLAQIQNTPNGATQIMASKILTNENSSHDKKTNQDEKKSTNEASNLKTNKATSNLANNVANAATSDGNKSFDIAIPKSQRKIKGLKDTLKEKLNENSDSLAHAGDGKKFIDDLISGASKPSEQSHDLNETKSETANTAFGRKPGSINSDGISIDSEEVDAIVRQAKQDLWVQKNPDIRERNSLNLFQIANQKIPKGF